VELSFNQPKIQCKGNDGQGSCYLCAAEKFIETHRSLLMMLGTQKHDNEKRCDNRYCCCNLGAVDNIDNWDHGCNSRSAFTATIVASIQKTVLYVKLSQLRTKGISMRRADARPERMEDATRKPARYNRSSCI
jgi:hypothetical protein